jgi:hypothetical protein
MVQGMPAPLSISTVQRRQLVSNRHRLTAAQRSDDPVAISDSLVALHSTDPATVYLTVVARMLAPRIEPLTTTLYDDRTLVRHHGMRRTVWVATPDVMRDIHASSTVPIAAKEWTQLRAWVARSNIESSTATTSADWLDSVVDRVLAELGSSGPLSARQLGKAVPELTRKIIIGTGNYTGEAAVHTRVLQNLGFDGRIVRTAPTGTWTSSEYAWQLAGRWLPSGLTGPDPTTAATALMRRYVDRFGPVTTVDAQWWTGWTKGATERALAASPDIVPVQLSDVDDDVGADAGGGSAEAWMTVDAIEQLPTPSECVDLHDRTDTVALLPSLDPTAMGWKQRDWYLAEFTAFGGPLFDRNGNVGPTVWVGGRVVGGWGQRSGGEVVTRLLVDVPAHVRTAIDEAADTLQRTIADARITPRFPTPLQRELQA